MTTNMKVRLLLGALVVVLAVATAQASVTIYNPAGLVLDVLVADGNVRVTTGMVAVNITQGQQDIQFKLGADGAVSLQVLVQDGDVLVLIPDPSDPLHSVQALKIQVGSVQFLSTSNSSSELHPDQEDQISATDVTAATLP